ncbi:aldolase [Rhodobacteraceae bacterium 2CG4]|uniref:Aldolase n=1 Tax=Halovulum marinum TaxID=2662447 RepID=A0A6L5Z3J6_9RHOB|nr:aldolase/citrate lyase family protein [Halovulum marinum]MSU91118.1 aldolase [Halovulum marinum]
MLKQRIAAQEPLIGTFLKTPHYALVEVLAQTGVDFVVLDAEHGPFTLSEIDSCVLAARAASLPILVRLVEGTPANVLRVLDMGASGIVVPQVSDADQAAAIVRSTRYGEKGRGFAGTTRAGGYGRLPASALAEIAMQAVVIVQIEDREGVKNADEIAATPGVDACFVGRADLAMSQGLADPNAPEIERATSAVFEQCKRHDVAPMVFVAGMQDCHQWFERGARLIAVGSEHKAIQDYFHLERSDAAKPQRENSGGRLAPTA